MDTLNQNAITIQIADHLDQVTSSSWNSLCQPDDYFTADYLHALAHAGLDCSFRYFIAQQAGQIVGITFGYFMHFPLLGPLQPLIFIAGSPVNLGFPFAFQKESQKEEIFLQLIQAMIADARKHHAAILNIRDLYAEHLETYNPTLKRLGFRHMPLFQRAWLDIQWHTFEEYLANFRASPRRNIVRDIRTINDNGYQPMITAGSEAQPYLADMARLFEYIFLKYRDRDQLFLPMSYFQAITALPECVAFLLFQNEQLAAFALGFERDSILETNYGGIDTTLTGKDPAHRYVEYEIIRYAISRGLKAIDFGVSNEENKMRLGCSLQGLSGSICPLSALSSAMMRLHVDRLLLPEYGFKVTPKNAGDDSSKWIRPTVFKSS